MTAAFRVRFELDARSQWVWQERARNGRVIGASSESFATIRAAIDNLLLAVPGYRHVSAVGLVNDLLPVGNPNGTIPLLVAYGKCPRCGENRSGVPDQNPDAIVCQPCWEAVEAEEDGA